MYSKNYCNLETRRHKENKYYSPGAIHSLVFPKADKETYLALQYQIQIRFDSSCEIMGSRIEDLATARFAFMEIELGQTFSGPGMAFVYNSTSRGGEGGIGLDILKVIFVTLNKMPTHCSLVTEHLF